MGTVDAGWAAVLVVSVVLGFIVIRDSFNR